MSELPEMEGVKMLSPMTIEVPSMVTSNKKILANWLFSKLDLSTEASFNRLLGNSSL